MASAESEQSSCEESFFEDCNCLDNFKTDLHACSLEVVHTKEKCFCTIGCYELEEEKRHRNGQILLFSIQGKENEAIFGDPIQTINSDSGILDGKWLSIKKKCFGSSALDETDDDSVHFYAAATASGIVQVYQLIVSHDDNSKDHRQILQLVTSSLDSDHDGSRICLALDWDRYSSLSSNSATLVRLACSYSDGCVDVFQVDLSQLFSPCNGREPLQLELIQTYAMAHCYRFPPSTKLPAEVWTVAFAQHDENILWSGGDDATCQIWDVRIHASSVGKVKDENSSFKWNAGVTTMAQHPTNPHWMAVGSYDEYVRFYDARYTSKPYQTKHVGGGVWRLKWQPPMPFVEASETSLLLVAAMHGGCRLLSHHFDSKNSDDAQVKEVQEFKLHKSMAYGADWIVDNHSIHDNHIVSSCSFYDNQAFLWKTIPILKN